MGAKFKEKLRLYLPAVTLDLFMVLVAWLGSYWLRFNLGVIQERFLEYAFGVLPVVLVTQGIALYLFGVFRGVWRFTSLNDLCFGSFCLRQLERLF